MRSDEGLASIPPQLQVRSADPLPEFVASRPSRNRCAPGRKRLLVSVALCLDIAQQNVGASGRGVELYGFAQPLPGVIAPALFVLMTGHRYEKFCLSFRISCAKPTSGAPLHSDRRSVIARLDVKSYKCFDRIRTSRLSPEDFLVGGDGPVAEAPGTQVGRECRLNPRAKFRVQV